ncbi:MAG: FtsW/RodA/SpoVE family cell cycle protein [Clostridia bacterium]|nr:FtsW/RodA/SpoVE family cell cycle protein [Clostridia bacterium]
MIADNRRMRAHTDWPLILLVAGLSLFGVIAVCVATYTPDSTAESLLAHIIESDSAMRQCFFLLLAPVIVTVMMNLPYHLFKRYPVPIYILATGMVAFTWLSNRAEGVKAWTDLIWGLTIQPSEFIKLAMILVLARDLSREDRPLSTPREFWMLMLRIAIPAVIILASGETGSLIVIIFFCAVMMFFSNVNMRLIFTLIIIAVLLVIALYAGMIALDIDDYRLRRILAFFNPELSPLDDAYQMNQSKMTIGSGGFSGIGIFQDGAMSQLNYVPADWTDFIFATIGEAWGFIGCSIIILVYFAIVLRMLYLARYTTDKFGMLVIIGVMGMLLFHIFENIGMTLGLMPITGIPLPFLSYGGSNMTTNMGGIGLVLNVTRNRSLAGTYSAPQLNPTARLRYQRES